MLLTFLSAIMVAIFAASVAFVIRRITGVNARWLIPASAGAAMLGFTLWNDYTWFDRQEAGLPPEVVVLDTYAHRAAIQPWTLAVPVVNRYRALDLRTLAPVAGEADMVRGLVYLAQRYQPTFQTLQIVDCARGRRADAATAGDGPPPEGEWFDLAPDDPLLATASDGGETG